MRFIWKQTALPMNWMKPDRQVDGTYNGKYGKPLKFRESVALETQKHPDAINHDGFPSTVLNPGEQYNHVCIYKFYTK